MSLKQRLHERPLSLGMQCFSGNPAVVEILGRAGFDWVSLDMEHSPTTLESVEHLARAAQAVGMASLVRVSRSDPTLIMQALDRGVDGVIVPHVQSAADLQRVVDATRYAPIGNRGACASIRANGYGTESWGDYVRRVHRELLVVALIEDEEAIAAFDKLLDVDGADVFWIGTRDLAQSMGVTDGDLMNPVFAEMARDLCARAAAHGKLMMATAGPVLTAQYAHYLHKLGFRCISFGTDLNNFSRFATSIVKELRVV